MSKFTTTSGVKSISLYTNPFSTEENSYYGRVTRNTVSLENLIGDITENQVGISAEIIYHAANLLTAEVIKHIQLGNAVDLLGAGTLYLKVNGSVKGENPSSSDVQGFTVGFTPSKEVMNAVSQVKIELVTVPDTGAKINTITNTFNQSQNKILFPGLGVRLTGSKLKITGEGSGIFFAPIVDEEPVTDETQWTEVDLGTVSTNRPSTLEFYVPNTLDTSKTYSIVLRTRYSAGREMKTPSTVYSSPVQIADTEEATA